MGNNSYGTMPGGFSSAKKVNAKLFGGNSLPTQDFSLKGPKWVTPDQARGELTGDRTTDYKTALNYGGALLPWLPAVGYESQQKNKKLKAQAEAAALDVGAPKADPAATDQAVTDARGAIARFAYGSYGRSDTIVTGPKGLPAGSFKPKTAIGY